MANSVDEYLLDAAICSSVDMCWSYTAPSASCFDLPDQMSLQVASEVTLLLYLRYWSFTAPSASRVGEVMFDLPDQTSLQVASEFILLLYLQYWSFTAPFASCVR